MATFDLVVGTMADTSEDDLVAWTPDRGDTVYEALGLRMTPESNRARLLVFVIRPGGDWGTGGCCQGRSGRS